MSCLLSDLKQYLFSVAWYKTKPNIRHCGTYGKGTSRQNVKNKALFMTKSLGKWLFKINLALGTRLIQNEGFPVCSAVSQHIDQHKKHF